MANFEIKVGDCIDAMRGIEPGTIDMVFADPPYNIGVDYGSGAAADRKSASEYRDWCVEWLAGCRTVLKPTGTLWVVSGQEFAAYIDIAIQDLGFTMRNRITWHETFGVYCHKKFGRCSRPIFYAVKDPKEFTFNKDAALVPSARQQKYNDKRASPKGKLPGDVWEVPRVCGTFGERVEGVPTQMPEELLERAIQVTTNIGDTILDPFAGSGTTLAVAKKLERNSIGIEISEDYARIAAKRLAQ